MTAFGRYSHRNLDNFEPPPIPGETGSPSNAFVHVLNEQGAGGFTFTVTPDLAARCAARRLAHQGRQGAPRRRRPDDARALRHHRPAHRPAVRGRPHRAGRHRLDDVGPAEQQPAVPGPVGVQPAHQLLVDSRAARASRPATSTRRSTRRSTTSIRSTAATLTAGSSAVRRRAAADPATYNLADFMFGLRNAYSMINPFIANLRQRMHFTYLQDDFRASRSADAEPRPALRVRHAAVGEGQLPHQLRPGHEHADSGEGRLDLRPGAGQPRSQQLRAAARPGLLDRRQDGDPQRLRHQLHPLQPARRREPAVVQRPARGRR